MFTHLSLSKSHLLPVNQPQKETIRLTRRGRRTFRDKHRTAPKGWIPSAYAKMHLPARALGRADVPLARTPKLSRRLVQPAERSPATPGGPQERLPGSPGSRLRLARTIYLGQTRPGFLGRRPAGRRRRARASPLCGRIKKRAVGSSQGCGAAAARRRQRRAEPSPGAG